MKLKTLHKRRRRKMRKITITIPKIKGLNTISYKELMNVYEKEIIKSLLINKSSILNKDSNEPPIFTGRLLPSEKTFSSDSEVGTEPPESEMMLERAVLKIETKVQLTQEGQELIESFERSFPDFCPSCEYRHPSRLWNLRNNFYRCANCGYVLKNGDCWYEYFEEK